MSVPTFRVRLLACLMLMAAAAAPAQPRTAAPPRADPLDPAAPVPLLRYETSLAAPAGSRPPVDWRDANQAVSRIGGWRAYARQAHTPDPPAAASAPAAQASGSAR
jgi:hypothetical protein